MITTFKMHYAIPDAEVGVVKLAMFAFRCDGCHADFHLDKTPSFCPFCGAEFEGETRFGGNA